MASFKNPLLGQLTGQIGGLIVYQLNGRTIIRRKPERKKNYKASKLQKFNQSAFREVQQVLLPLKDVLDFGFGEFMMGMKRGIHLAMSWAMKHAITGESDKPILHKTALKVSRGDLPLPAAIRFVRQGSDGLRVTWDAQGSLGTARVTDNSWVVLYHPTDKLVFEIREGAHRSSESQLIPLSGAFREAGVLAFLAFYRSKGRKRFRFSDSFCMELD
jgi:hypothetical protein